IVDRVGRVLDNLAAGDEVEFPRRQHAPAIRLGELRSGIDIVAPRIDVMVPLEADQHAQTGSEVETSMASGQEPCGPEATKCSVYEERSAERAEIRIWDERSAVGASEPM